MVHAGVRWRRRLAIDIGGFLQAAWRFGLAEAVCLVVAMPRWWLAARAG
jgi:hypothetical protein